MLYVAPTKIQHNRKIYIPFVSRKSMKIVYMINEKKGKERTQRPILLLVGSEGSPRVPNIGESIEIPREIAPIDSGKYKVTLIDTSYEREDDKKGEIQGYFSDPATGNMSARTIGISEGVIVGLEKLAGDAK